MEAVDHASSVLKILVQRRRDKKAVALLPGAGQLALPPALDHHRQSYQTAGLFGRKYCRV